MAYYLSTEERVWNKIKRVASTESTKKCSISTGRARALIDKIIDEERACSTPAEAREYFAKELYEMANASKHVAT